MGHTVALDWHPVATDGVARRFRRSGTYRAYVPDPLADNHPILDPATLALVDKAHALAAGALTSVTHAGLGHVADLLARSEASASSLIEGYEPSARSVAVADFVQRGRSAPVTVARNVQALRRALARSTDPGVSLVEEAVALQRVIAPEVPGVRRQPVWIGGRTPLEAHYVAPPHELVPELLADLDAYVESRRHSAVIAAAIAHAQFETIHPFGDGNGRVGRVLVGMILSRYGLTPGLALPVSTELFRDRERYYAALDDFRGLSAGEGRRDSIVAVLAEAVCVAAEQAIDLSHELEEWEADQTRTLNAYLRAHTPSGRARLGLAHRLIPTLAAHPVLDAADVATREAATDNAARSALETLAEAGVVRRDRKADRTRIVYVATSLLDLITPSGVTGFDSDPSASSDEVVIPLASRPGVAGEQFRCGYWLPRAERTCSLAPGHRGQHR